ncbi:hypothetical protein SDC9_44025 [bioreactor metagenome]|uniref:Glycosyltransferase 2-like domain-containing protein n=1 Tax=bioreactor metagenome TaxID=1076179 RepID=A0A644W308_9ZZZZ
MNQVAIYTQAYNAEKTIRRTIESVLHQTEERFVYYILENGSTDKTRDIILEYAREDKRITPLLYDENDLFRFVEILPFIFSERRGKFFATLDADDEYNYEFLEKMLDFTNINSLDVAMCGSNFIDARNNQILGKRQISKNLIISGRGFSDNFSQYHAFIRPYWGKLYSMALFHNFSFENVRKVSYGSDTIFVIEALRQAERAGILAETLHKYYVSPKSASYHFDDRRIESDQIQDDITRSYLKEKCGVISAVNEQFMSLVYANAIHDTLNVLLNSVLSSTEKIQQLSNIFSYVSTQKLFLNENIIGQGLDKMLRDPTVKWLLTQKECRKPEYARKAAKILMAMYEDLPRTINKDGLIFVLQKMPEILESILKKDYVHILERLQTWFKRHMEDSPALSKLELDSYRFLKKSDEELFSLFATIKKLRPVSFKALNLDQQTRCLLQKYPLLKEVSANLAFALTPAIHKVIKGNFTQALKSLLAIQNLDINDNDAEAYILLGENLAAVADNADVYIYFKKFRVSYLLDCSCTNEAGTELDELESILPDDEDFVELRRRLTELLSK